jgi:hypothetical protein
MRARLGLSFFCVSRASQYTGASHITRSETFNYILFSHMFVSYLYFLRSD